ncbi:ATP-NAD kinase family protein [Aestuariibacter sp. A3R04]|uniref:ATP-NAD kinase family protein n=1 Tax=Aestuariibacter sp. A3R04 TaxID=2841571 RepID=UPI001C0802B2|nr:ATP-NAD kinase family protein [Aestuariibacter sp. A3R04]MBU3023313.1 ATP-NAD kinase family protein [Aestuariibacter sp. A3R04]
MSAFKLGLVVNPYSGIGGALALKGSDGEAIRTQALQAGAELLAEKKMARALEKLIPLNAQIHIYTATGAMGEDISRLLGFSHTVVYTPPRAQTEGEDTEAAVNAIRKVGVDLLLFAGGDGTARNVCRVIKNSLPVLGVPAGCKIHSGVYAVTPPAAGEVVAMMVKGELVSEVDAEVRDIDEDAFRAGRVLAKSFGEMRVPDELGYVQAVKMGGKESDELVLDDIAAHIQDIMNEEPNTLFVMGSGSTVAGIMASQQLQNTLLGVDVVQGGSVIATDVTARQLLDITANKPCKLVITLIGGQGHIFGRGNQQLSPTFLRQLSKDEMLIVATKAKLRALDGRPLRLDTGDTELDEALTGYFSVITGYRDKVLYPAT